MPHLTAHSSAPDPLGGSAHDYLHRMGPDLTGKTEAFSRWIDARVAQGGFPFSKRLLAAPGPETAVRHTDGAISAGLNFASQDYLSLAAHPRVTTAAIDAIQRYGVHSAGSPVLAGGIDLSDKLEATIADHLRTPFVTLFPTGWAAGYGAVRGLVREADHVVIDQLAHNCLHESASAATRQVHVFRHLDLVHARLKLAAIRAKSPHGGILVVTEALFSMEADAADLAAFQAVAREFGALLLVNVSHDLGAVGPNGTGQLGLQNMLGKVDLVVGSFSKVFASNGGFVAAHRREVRDYLRYLASTATFSSALAPMQIAAALAAFGVVRSAEGEQRRQNLRTAVHALRGALERRDVPLLGVAAPIVPVLIGRDDVARTAVRLLARDGVIANLVEFPAVSRSTARLRLQLMSGHDPAALVAAAERIAAAIATAREQCAPRVTPAAVAA